MSENLKLCEACNEPFDWDDMVVVIEEDKLYHKECMQLYPIGFVAFINGDWIGETKNDDGQSAYEILEEEELVGVPE